MHLKCCGKCMNILYCSRACQDRRWPAHKKTLRTSTKKRLKPGLNTSDPIAWLHKFSELEVYTRLIDCYRLRIEDEYVFDGDASWLYAGEDPTEGFSEFLALAKGKEKAMLPEWWDEAKELDCISLATEMTPYAVQVADIKEEYRDWAKAMWLRGLAEVVYGEGVGVFGRKWDDEEGEGI